jgi:hypothetical protein
MSDIKSRMAAVNSEIEVLQGSIDALLIELDKLSVQDIIENGTDHWEEIVLQKDEGSSFPRYYVGGNWFVDGDKRIPIELKDPLWKTWGPRSVGCNNGEGPVYSHSFPSPPESCRVRAAECPVCGSIMSKWMPSRQRWLCVCGTTCAHKASP